MSTLAVWCRVVQSRDVRSRVFSRPVFSKAVADVCIERRLREQHANSFKLHLKSFRATHYVILEVISMRFTNRMVVSRRFSSFREVA